MTRRNSLDGELATFDQKSLKNDLNELAGLELINISQKTSGAISEQVGTIRNSIEDFQVIQSRIESVNMEANTIQEHMDTVVSESDINSQKLGLVNDNMQLLEERFQSVNSMISSIRSISDKTNFLALNANIEASRAGDAGRRFSVVANEVKELSVTTKNASENIYQNISEISEAIKELSANVDGALKQMADSIVTLRDTQTRVDHVNEETSAFHATVQESLVNFRSLDEQSEEMVHDVNELDSIGKTFTYLVELLRSSGSESVSIDPLERLGPLVEGSEFNAPERFTTHEEEYTLKENEVILSATDARGFITFANNIFYDVAQYDRGELIGKPHNILRHPDMPKMAFADLWETVKSGNIWQGYVLNRGKLGRVYWVKATVFPCIENGEITGFLSIRNKPLPEAIATAKQAYRLVR